MKSFRRFLLAAMALVMTVCVCFGNVGRTFAEDKWEVHYWNFDDTLDDASGKLNLSAGGPAYAQGRNGKALNTAAGTTAATGKLTCDTVTGFTMGAWIYLNKTASGWQIIMAKGNTFVDGNPERFQIHLGQVGENGDEREHLLVYAPATFGNGIGIDSDNPDNDVVEPETWTHVATTWDGYTAKLFMNGVKIFEYEIERELGKSLDQWNKITVGSLADGKTFQFDGLIDDAFYANYAMTEADIAACAAADGPATLKGWSDGSKAFTPAEMKAVNQGPEESGHDDPEAKKKGRIFFWQFEGNTTDLSHYEFDQDVEETLPDYEDGIVGKAMVIMDRSIATDPFPEDIDLSEFTLSMWYRWDGIEGALPYYILAALGEKELSYHFEIYLKQIDADTAGVAIYNTGYAAIENLATVKAEEFFNVTVVQDTNSERVYVNGELVQESVSLIRTDVLGDGEERFTIGSLQNYTLPAYGAYDQVVLAEYAFSEDLIKKLYSEPQAANDEIVKLVEANYPEGYTKATPAPTEAPTAAPTDVPVQDVTPVPQTDITEAPKATDVPVKATEAPSKDGSSNTAVTIIIIAAAVVVILVIATVLVLKKGKKK